MADTRKAFLSKRIVKSKQHIQLSDLPDSPVSVLKGVGAKAAENLSESFYVKTVRDLADLKYAVWAQELLALEKVPQSKIDMHSFSDKLIKKYESTAVKTLLGSPIHVLQGVSENDEKRMRELGVKTVRELARLKYVTWAQEIMQAVYIDMSTPAVSDLPDDSEDYLAQQQLTRPDDNTGRLFEKRGLQNTLFWYVILALILIGVIYLWARGCPPTAGEIFEPSGSEQQNDQVEVKNADGDKAAAAGPGNTLQEGSQAVSTTVKAGTAYTVQSGDTLFELSRRAYGSDIHWKKIYLANEDKIEKPDYWVIKGRVLQIPE